MKRDHFPRPRPRYPRRFDDPEDDEEDVVFISKPASTGIPRGLAAWWQRVRSYVGVKSLPADETFVTVSGGADHGASADYSTIPGGRQAKAYLYGQWAYSAGGLAGIGSAQHSLVLLRRGFTSGGAIQPRPLFLDGESRPLVLENNTAYGFRIEITGWALDKGSAAMGAWRIEGCARRGTGPGTVVLVGSTVTELAMDAGAPPAPFIQADLVNGGLSILGYTTGVTGQQVAYVAAAWLVESAW